MKLTVARFKGTCKFTVNFKYLGCLMVYWKDHSGYRQVFWMKNMLIDSKKGLTNLSSWNEESLIRMSFRVKDNKFLVILKSSFIKIWILQWWFTISLLMLLSSEMFKAHPGVLSKYCSMSSTSILEDNNWNVVLLRTWK